MGAGRAAGPGDAARSAGRDRPGRAFREVDSAAPFAVFEALREALDGGPAVLLREPGSGAAVGAGLTAAASSAAGSGSSAGAELSHDVPDWVAGAELSRDVPDRVAGAELSHDVPDRVAVVVQTSGSTGSPKRVGLSADALRASAAASAAAVGGSGQWLLALPAHYIAGVNVLVRSIVAGTVPRILPSAHFDPHLFAAETAELDPDNRFTALVPAQLARLLDAGDRVADAARSYRRILVGGQHTPAPLLARALDAGFAVTRTYGSSETSGGCVYDGVPLPGVRVRVVDGRIHLGGPTLAEGYLGDPQLTATTFVTEAGERWYRTSDLGEFTDGVLRVTGRVDDIIITGGLKVSLALVERVVRELDGLADAIVVAAPDSRWGQVPVVVGAAVDDLPRIRDAVQLAVGAAARPAFVLPGPVPQLPSGKPDRVWAAAGAAAGAAAAAAADAAGAAAAGAAADAASASAARR